MKGYREKSFGDRMNTAAAARKATLQRVLAKPGANDPAVIEQKAARAAIVAAREARLAARHAEQKAARDARYAARKARK
jgi:hypothetical protein